MSKNSGFHIVFNDDIIELYKKRNRESRRSQDEKEKTFRSTISGGNDIFTSSLWRSKTKG